MVPKKQATHKEVCVVLFGNKTGPGHSHGAGTSQFFRGAHNFTTGAISVESAGRDINHFYTGPAESEEDSE